MGFVIPLATLYLSSAFMPPRSIRRSHSLNIKKTEITQGEIRSSEIGLIITLQAALQEV